MFNKSIVRDLALVTLFAAATPAFATNNQLPPAGSHLQDLLAITNDQDAGVSYLSLLLDEMDEPIGIYFVTNKHDGIPPTVTRFVFTAAEVASPEGVVLVERQGRNIFYLNGGVDSTRVKGTLQVRYLANGILNSYDECYVNMRRSPQGVWSLVNAYNGKAVSVVRTLTWAFGVTTVENLCPED